MNNIDGRPILGVVSPPAADGLLDSAVEDLVRASLADGAKALVELCELGVLSYAPPLSGVLGRRLLVSDVYAKSLRQTCQLLDRLAAVAQSGKTAGTADCNVAEVLAEVSRLLPALPGTSNAISSCRCDSDYVVHGVSGIEFQATLLALLRAQTESAAVHGIELLSRAVPGERFISLSVACHGEPVGSGAQLLGRTGLSYVRLQGRRMGGTYRFSAEGLRQKIYTHEFHVPI